MNYPKLDLTKLPQDIIIELSDNLQELFHTITWYDLDYTDVDIKVDAKTKRANKKLYKEIKDKKYSLSVEGKLELYQRFLSSPLFVFCKHAEYAMFLDADGIFTHQGYWDWLLQAYPFSYIETCKNQLEIQF